MNASDEKLSSFPAFFRIAGEKVAVFGNGDEAYAKARLLAGTRARIVAFADEPEPAYAGFLAERRIEVVGDILPPSPFAGFRLVFAATGDDGFDRMIVSAARAANIPANAVDQPDYCDFFTPAIVSRAPVAVAIGTEGAGPVLAQMIRMAVDRLLPASLGRLARLAVDYRAAAERRLPRGAARRGFWQHFFSGSVAEAVAAGDIERARGEAERLLSADHGEPGRVFLVGAGPGAEDLLTLRAHRLLMQADAIVYDALVPPALVDMGRRDAERFPVGKRKGCHSKTQDEINRLLVQLGREGRRVVRLKSGDPLVYGRAAEEMDALRQAGVAYEVVPGITSAFAAAADFELPLTVRGVASSLIFTTGHDLTGEVLPDWASLAVSGATVAVYMGSTVAASVAERLMQVGLARETPVAVVENASRANRRLLHGTLKDLPDLAGRDDLSGPVMVVIGEAVAGARFDHSENLAVSRSAAAPILENER